MEFEIDLSVPDRYAEHLDDKSEVFDEPDIVLPEWHGSDDDFEETFSAESLWKGRMLVLRNKIKQVEGAREGLFEVQGSELYVTNVVSLQGSVLPGVTCTCPNGSSRAGRPTCYHAAAALMLYTGVDLERFPEPVKKTRGR